MQNKQNWINKQDWIKIGGWNSSFLTDYLSAEAIQEEKMKASGYPLGIKGLLVLGSDYFLSKESFEEIADYILTKAREEGPAFFTKFKKVPVEHGEKLLEFSKQVRKTDVNKLTDDELNELFVTFTKLVKPRMAFGFLLQPFDDVLSILLKEKLTSYLESESIANPDTFLVDLIPPKRPATMIQEKTDLLKLALEIEDLDPAIRNINFKEKIKEHRIKYGWMNNFDWASYPFSEEHYIEKIKTIKDSAPEELKKIEEKRKHVEERYENLITKIENEGFNIKELVETIRDFISLKMETWEAVSIAGDDCLNLFTEIGKRNGLACSEVFFLSPEEIINLNPQSKENKREEKESEENKSKEKAGKRRKTKGVLMSGDKIRELNKEEVKGLLEEFSKVEEVQEIKGRIAYPGFIQGKATVILNSNEIHKVKEGDILVCPMTDPDYMVAAEKVKAIVTDHGGILCHAAIVSREFKLPCVVGTNIATKVFHDGDLVEVDANKGIIRKIK